MNGILLVALLSLQHRLARWLSGWRLALLLGAAALLMPLTSRFAVGSCRTATRSIKYSFSLVVGRGLRCAGGGRAGRCARLTREEGENAGGIPRGEGKQRDTEYLIVAQDLANQKEVKTSFERREMPRLVVADAGGGNVVVEERRGRKEEGGPAYVWIWEFVRVMRVRHTSSQHVDCLEPMLRHTGALS